MTVQVRPYAPDDWDALVEIHDAARLDETAFLARFRSETAMREAALELEKARALPDFEVSAGARYFNESDGEAAFVVGFQIPPRATTSPAPRMEPWRVRGALGPMMVMLMR